MEHRGERKVREESRMSNPMPMARIGLGTTFVLFHLHTVGEVNLMGGRERRGNTYIALDAHPTSRGAIFAISL